MTFGQAVRELDLRDPLSGDRITPKELLRILKEDVVYALERPGSWEGARMLYVFEAHGFFNHHIR